MVTKFFVLWIVTHSFFIQTSPQQDQYGRNVYSSNLALQIQTIDQPQHRLFATEPEARQFLQQYQVFADQINSRDVCKDFQIVPFECDSTWDESKSWQEFVKFVQEKK